MEELNRKIDILVRAIKVLLEEVGKIPNPFSRKISRAVLTVLEELDKK
jgi:hypothetical protein